MALPAGVTKLGSFKGAKGDTGTIAFATAETIPWTATPEVEMVGPESNRGAHFRIPLPLPGPETVNNDDATELLLLNPTKTRAASLATAGAALSADDANQARLGMLRAVRPATGWDGVPLKRFRQALAERKTRRVTIAHLGDSITAGAGGGLDGRFTSVFVDELRRLYPTNGKTTGGRGFLSVTPDNYGPVTGNATIVSGGTNAFSPDGHMAALASGYSITWTFTGTGVDILYLMATGAGAFNWAVDGGSGTTVSADATYPNELSVVQVRGLAPGDHTLTLSGVDTTVRIAGVIAYDEDETSGFSSIVGGVGGATTAYWTTTATPPRWASYLPVYQPDLFVIGLGTNDYYHPTAHITAAAYKTNLETIIAEIKNRTTVDPSIVLLAPAVTNASAPLDPWIDYKTALHAIAAADHANIAVFDWGYPMNPTSTATTAGGLMGADLVHPTSAGHEFIGKALARFVGVV